MRGTEADCHLWLHHSAPPVETAGSARRLHSGRAGAGQGVYLGPEIIPSLLGGACKQDHNNPGCCWVGAVRLAVTYQTLAANMARRQTSLALNSSNVTQLFIPELLHPQQQQNASFISTVRALLRMKLRKKVIHLPESSFFSGLKQKVQDEMVFKPPLSPAHVSPSEHGAAFRAREDIPSKETQSHARSHRLRVCSPGRVKARAAKFPPHKSARQPYDCPAYQEKNKTETGVAGTTATRIT